MLPKDKWFLFLGVTVNLGQNFIYQLGIWANDVRSYLDENHRLLLSKETWPMSYYTFLLGVKIAKQTKTKTTEIPFLSPTLSPHPVHTFISSMQQLWWKWELQETSELIMPNGDKYSGEGNSGHLSDTTQMAHTMNSFLTFLGMTPKPIC
jgi:hypothetical protein